MNAGIALSIVFVSEGRSATLRMMCAPLALLLSCSSFMRSFQRLLLACESLGGSLGCGLMTIAMARPSVDISMVALGSRGGMPVRAGIAHILSAGLGWLAFWMRVSRILRRCGALAALALYLFGVGASWLGLDMLLCARVSGRLVRRDEEI